MVRPYLNKSDHEEYLRQYKAERNKRIKKRLWIGAIASVVLLGIYFSIFGGSNSISDSFPAYLGGEPQAQPYQDNPELEGKGAMVAEEDTENSLEQQLPEILDSNRLPVETQIEDIGSEEQKIEEESNYPNSNELEASELQTPNQELASSFGEVARSPIAEKVSDRSGMRKNPELGAASILFSAEKMPKFPGGYTALKRYIKKSLQVPEQAKQQKVEGTVQVQFIVEVNGSIQSPRIAKGLGYGCDEAALSLVKGMPKWIPGKHNGEEVAVYYNLPIKFSKK
ncbi:MAG: energy transducer TonB [Bacteroidota bacterium]